MCVIKTFLNSFTGWPCLHDCDILNSKFDNQQPCYPSALLPKELYFPNMKYIYICKIYIITKYIYYKIYNCTTFLVSNKTNLLI